MPTIRPKEAPIAIDGTKMPAGTLQPYEIMTRNVLMIVAKASDKAMVQRFLDLVLLSVTKLLPERALLTRIGHRSHGLPRTHETESPCFLSCRSSETYLGNIILP